MRVRTRTRTDHTCSSSSSSSRERRVGTTGSPSEGTKSESEEWESESIATAGVGAGGALDGPPRGSLERDRRGETTGSLTVRGALAELSEEGLRPRDEPLAERVLAPL